jgi:hypothetical protein
MINGINGDFSTTMARNCMELPELDFLHFPPASTTLELRGFVHGMVSYQHDFDGVL